MILKLYDMSYPGVVIIIIYLNTLYHIYIYIPGAYGAPILEQGHVPLWSTPPCIKTRPCHKNMVPLILAFFVGVCWNTHNAKIFRWCLYPLIFVLIPTPSRYPLLMWPHWLGKSSASKVLGWVGGSGDSSGLKSLEIQSASFLPHRSSKHQI